jgi:uncharacterized membrane-anchored protein YjiN (DUF445 family)
MGKRKDQEAVIFRLPADVKKKLQMKVLEEGTSIQELLESFVYDYLDLAEERKVFESIVKIAQGNTDFESGFDRLFGFIAENPESRTTKDFINYHIIEMNSPASESGPDFTYLIGKEFVAEHWINEDDLDKFQEFCEAQRRG